MLHIHACMAFNMSGTDNSCCTKPVERGLYDYLEGALANRGMDVLLSRGGCEQCSEQGPLLRVQGDRQGAWKVTSAQSIDVILDVLQTS